MKMKNPKNPLKETADIREEKNSVKKGLRTGWTRTTLVIREDHLELLKLVAWWKKTNIKEILVNMIDEYAQSNDVKSIVSKIESIQRNSD